MREQEHAGLIERKERLDSGDDMGLWIAEKDCEWPPTQTGANSRPHAQIKELYILRNEK
jgi:hypothetical protein